MVPSTSMDPFSIFRMVKQSAWPKWAERWASRPPSPTEGTASFMVMTAFPDAQPGCALVSIRFFMVPRFARGRMGLACGALADS